MKKIFKTFIILGIIICSIENSFSTDENIEIKEIKSVRPSWDNQIIQPTLKTIWNSFYKNKRIIPCFLDDFKLMFKINKQNANKQNANKQLSNFVNQLNITMPIDKIEISFKEFNIITLRPLTKDKLILSCGNYITDSESKYFPTHSNKDMHEDADTVDINIGINPSIVADLSSSGFYAYLLSLNKKYNTVIAEGGYTLHGPTGLEKLRNILNINGTYKIEMGAHFTISNTDQQNSSKKLLNDQYFSLSLPQKEYEEILNTSFENINKYLLLKMNDFYKENGFNFQIQHPECFILKKINSGEDEKISHSYSIGRDEIEASDIALVRIR